MKNIKQSFFLLLIISYSSVFAQENIATTIIEPLQKDALYREKVFIQSNKTIYFTNENIWFSAYVADDSKNIPSSYTSNLHVNLLNQQGYVIDSKNIFIKEGIGTGDFFIDESYKSGKYFIQGFTNYMRNFGKENVFIQEIEIVNPDVKKEIKQENYTNKYDIQVFPESGYLLENAENTIGIKALINGKGFPFSGKIVNSKGLEITSFKGNPFGMSKCNFNYVKNETYTAIVTINNTVQKIILPKANSTGCIFSVDNTSANTIKITLKTNKETLPSLKNESLAILFYRHNFICEAVTLSLENSQETTQELFFDKSKMLNGVNIVTLFKNNQPIAERKFFVDKLEEQAAILIKELKTENDSTNFKIQTLNSNYKPVSAILSVSVLPKESKTFYENQHIKSAFLLSPYIKGKIENPSYYFRNNNLKEKGFLDLLMLNQGWTAYSLEEKIEKMNPKKQFDFESGFTLSGTLKKFPKGYDIGILSKQNRLAAFSKINEKKEFSFEKVFAYKKDSIKIALIKKNMSLVKPSQVSFTTELTKNENYNYLTNKYNPIIIEKKASENSENYNISSYKQYPNMEVLDLIMLKTVVSRKEKTFYDKENELAHKHKVLAPSFYQNKKVTELMETSFQTVFDYFMSLGYIKSTYQGNYFISLRNARVTLFGKNMNPDNTYPPKIFLDGVSLNRDGDIETLKELSIKDIDEILINKSGAGGGIDGAGGIIKIYLKKGNHQYFEEEGKNLYENLILLTCFDKAASYYKPMYNIYTENSFNWTEIAWKNNLITNKNGEVIIKIPTNEFSNEFQFIINGFSDDGLLFNTVYKTGSTNF